MRHFVGLREGLIVGLSVGIVVDHIVSLILGLSLRLSVEINVFLNLGPGVGFSVIWSLVQYMVGISVVRGLEIFTWMSTPVNPNHLSNATKATTTAIRKIFARGYFCSKIVYGPSGYGIGYTNAN